MSRKIDESFLKAFAGNLAAYVAGRAIGANGDKIKKALGIDSDEFDDVDAEMAALEKQKIKLQKKLEKRLQDAPPEIRDAVIAAMKKRQAAVDAL